MKNLNHNSISVVIPAYNAQNSIFATLESVRNQIIPADEIIVVIDGSTDLTPKIVEKFKDNNKNINLTVIYQNNKGIGAARNTGINSSTSNYIAFLDSDDVWYNSKLKTCHEILSKNHNIDILNHAELLVKGNFKRKLNYGTINNPKYETLLFEGNKLSPSSTIVRTSILKNIGGFSENLEYNSAEDYDLWLRISSNKNINFFYIDRILGIYNISNQSITNNRYYHFEKSENVLKLHLKKLENNGKLKKNAVENILNVRKFKFYILEVFFSIKKLNLKEALLNMILFLKLLRKITIANLIIYFFKGNKGFK